MVRRFQRTVWILMVLLVPVAVLMTSVHTPYAQQADRESVLADYERGISLFKQGFYARTVPDEPGVPHGALYYFERVQRRINQLDDPQERAATVEMLIHHSEAGTMRQLRAARHHNDVVSAQVRAFADWMQSQAARSPLTRSTNRRAIARDLSIAVTDSSPERREQMAGLVRDRYGEFAVPEIHRLYLHSGNQELMARASGVLQKLGPAAVLPLIEIMKSPRLLDRRNAAQALGMLGDERAVPVLVQHLQDPETEREVLGEIRIALERILGPVETDGDLVDAKQHYYQQALKYYHHLPEMIVGRGQQFVLWRWVPYDRDSRDSRRGFLDYEQIPMWAYMDALAEEACLGALRLDPDFDEAWDLLVNINLRQNIQAQSRLEGVERARRAGDSRELNEEHEQLLALSDRFHRGAVLAGTAGQEALYRAIDRALSDREPELAVAAIEKLTDVGDDRHIPKRAEIQQPEDVDNFVGAPLIRALKYYDKRVRYAAAQALFSLNNNRLTGFEPFYLMDVARDVLIQGLGESAQRSILVITNNIDLRNNMRQALDELGYYAHFAESPTEGLRRAQSFPSDDLILIDIEIANFPVRTTDGRENGSQTIFDLLQDDFRTQDIDIVLMADSSEYDDRQIFGAGGDFEAEFNDGPLEYWLPYRDNEIAPLPADLGVFQNIWRKRQSDARERANRMAITSAQALLTWNPDDIELLEDNQFFWPVIRALVARINDARTNNDVKVAMLQALNQFVQAKDPVKYPTDTLWNQDVIPNLLPVLTADPHIHQPVVKYWACRVLANIYKNRPDDADWDSSDPWGSEARDPHQNIFWALVELLDFAPSPEEADEMLPRGLDAAAETLWWRQHNETVRNVREAAGNVMGTAPMTSLQRLYVNERARVHRPVPIHYGRSNNDD